MPACTQVSTPSSSSLLTGHGHRARLLGSSPLHTQHRRQLGVCPPAGSTAELWWWGCHVHCSPLRRDVIPAPCSPLPCSLHAFPVSPSFSSFPASLFGFISHPYSSCAPWAPFSFPSPPHVVPSCPGCPHSVLHCASSCGTRSPFDVLTHTSSQTLMYLLRISISQPHLGGIQLADLPSATPAPKYDNT